MGKAFETDKHGYKIAAVEAYIAESKSLVAAQKERIAELQRELDDKEAELRAFKQKQELIVKSIQHAAEKAEQIELLIKQKFAAEMAHLGAFHSQWLDYYKKLIETYPLEGQLRPLGEFNRRMTAILTGDDDTGRKLGRAQEEFLREKKRLDTQNLSRRGFNEDNSDDEDENEVYNRPSDIPQKKKYIGFIPVGESDEFEMEDFDPEESIRQMFRRQANEEERSSKPLKGDGAGKSGGNGGSFGKSAKNVGKSAPAKPTAKPTGKGATNKNGYKSPIAATVSPTALGISDSGFSFEEALNPQQDLSDILKEIGLKLGE